MTQHVKVSGALRPVAKKYVKIGGILRLAQSNYVKFGAGVSNTLTKPAPTRYVYNLDGINDYFALTNGLVLSDGYDIKVKFKLNAPLGSIHPIFGRFSGFNSLANITNAGGIRVRPTGNSSSALEVFTTSGLITPGEWYELRVTRAGNNYSIYLDGEIKGSLTTSQSAGVIETFGAFNNSAFGQIAIAYVDFNGTRWVLDNPNSSIQVSNPVGNSMTLINGNNERWSHLQLPFYTSPWDGFDVAAFTVGDGDLTASVGIKSNGAVVVYPGGEIGNWISHISSAGHQIRCTLISKDTLMQLSMPSGWVSLSADVFVVATTEALGFRSLTGTVRIEIRDSSNTVVCDGVVTLLLSREY